MIVLSALPLAKNLESEEKAKHMTIEACAVNALNACPDGTYDRAGSHCNYNCNRTVVSITRIDDSLQLGAATPERERGALTVRDIAHH